MVPATLAEWLAHAERQHSVGIDLGLDRITRVARAMGFAPPDYRPAPRSVIVAGTNGKGSTTIFIEALLRATGHRVGATLSPHVHRFNERVRLDGAPVDDATLCAAFAAVEQARGAVPLTYFEYSALVALQVFRAADVEIAVLEVGLGGRLDAFNLVGADLAVITSIGLDHEAFLGSDLEQIGREKAGVMRPGRPVVIGSDVTASVRAEARRLGCPLLAMGEHFSVHEAAGHWSFEAAPSFASAASLESAAPPELAASSGIAAGAFERLPWGALAPYNCALAIAAAGCLTPVSAAAVHAALAAATLPGRCEPRQVDGCLLLLDVAHNPAGAAFLARQVRARYPGRRFVGLLGMLADKDAAGVADAFPFVEPAGGDANARAETEAGAEADTDGAGLVTHWICVSTGGPRGQGADVLAGRLRAAYAGPAAKGSRTPTIEAVEDLAEGLTRASRAATGCAGSGILAFGSFDLVERLRNLLVADPVAGGGRG